LFPEEVCFANIATAILFVYTYEYNNAYPASILCTEHRFKKEKSNLEVILYLNNDEEYTSFLI